MNKSEFIRWAIKELEKMKKYSEKYSKRCVII